MSTSKKSQGKQKNKVNTMAGNQNNKHSGKRILIISILVGVCVIALIPLIDYMAMNRTYIKINKEKIGRLEYEYNFVEVRDEQSVIYESLLSGLGVTNTGGLSNLTIHSNSDMKDRIDQSVVGNFINNKMLLAKAEEEGFVYDTSEEYAAFEATIQAEAEAAGVPVNDYVKSKYGTYATLKRIDEFVKEDIVASAYYAHKMEQFAPTEDELLAYYEDNKESLDSFDFWLTVIKAEDLEESEDLEDVLKEAEDNILTEGTLYENMIVAGLDTNMLDWLYEADRKEGDLATVKHSEKEIYYVLSFVDRYLDESLTADIRLIKTSGKNSQEILELWKKEEATEESFAELCMYYSEDGAASNGGLYEGLVNGNLSDELNDWIYEDGREPGDVATIQSSDGYEYVLYYVKQNSCKWKLTAADTITSERMTAYMDEITADVVVKTPGNKVSYE